ncbi:hypothetical protein [Kitasatospora phosalacinea]|uniref:Uncharacterized protein n=1 Tax=Kitasatospora phosalacinea TaxID=2065 RepID=A0A9W6PND4_9ACTN|nr:hypothetical protein [Kitasatospora phosalacinea]GLW58187.1 hypothetical protein Kpho01_61980 [Kitasatospora phosalacinea]
MSDIAVEDVQRLADLADRLADVRRDVRHTARRPPAQMPDLLAQSIASLGTYIAVAAGLRVEMSHRRGPRVLNVGEDWGPSFAATRAAPVLYRLTELLGRACDLANQTRPRSTIRSHFYSPGLEQRVADEFKLIDEMLSHTITEIRRTRSGLAQVRKRELAREQEALADPDGKAARYLAERARLRAEPLVMVPSGYMAEAAETAAKAARRRGATRIVSSPPPTGTNDTPSSSVAAKPVRR